MGRVLIKQVFFFSVLAIFLLLLVVDRNVYNENLLLGVLCLDVFSIFIFLNSKECVINLKGQKVRIVYFFLIGFCIVHFQMYFDLLLGNYYYFGHDYLFDINFVTKSAITSSIGLIVFLIGYSFDFSFYFKKHNRFINTFDISLYIKGINFNKIQSVIFGILLLLMGTLVVLVDRSYFNGGYGRDGIELSGITNYINQFIVFFNIAYYVISILFYKKKYGLHSSINMGLFVSVVQIKYLFLLFVYCTLTLMSGDRGPVIQLILVSFSSFLLMGNVKISFKKLSLLIISGVFLMSFVAFIRENKDSKSYSEKIELALKNQQEASKNYSFLPATHELATSVRTVQAAVIYTSESGYTYGVFQIMQIVNIIPGIGTLLGGVLGINVSEMNSAVFLTHQILGNFPSHGLGTSAIADVYLDFGIVGVILLFFVFGVFVRKIELGVFVKGYSNLFYYSFFLVVISFSIYIGRSTIISVFRDCFMVYIIVSMLCSLFKYDRKKNI